MDLIIQNAFLRDGSIADIGIEGNRIVHLGPNLTAENAQIIDASGKLALPAFVNGHLHVAKSFWRRALALQPDNVQKLPRFEAAAHVKRSYTVEEVFERVEETIKLAILNGTGAIRLFVDVNEAAGTRALEAVLQVKQKYWDAIQTQVAAFPQDGVYNGRGTEELMHRAMEMGADLVGGILWIERNEHLQKEHVEMCFRLAGEYDDDLHFVCDDTENPDSRTLEYVAAQTIKRGMEGRVCATQCNALAFYDDAYAADVIALVKEAGITIFHNAHVSLVTTNIASQPAPRGCTRVKELLAAGVPVATAQDDIDDWYYPFGRNDMLEVAQYMASVAQLAWPEEIDQTLSMVTDVPARAIGLSDYGLEVGRRADIVILEAADWHQALQFQSAKTHVIHGGRLVAITEVSRKLL